MRSLRHVSRYVHRMDHFFQKHGLVVQAWIVVISPVLVFSDLALRVPVCLSKPPSLVFQISGGQIITKIRFLVVLEDPLFRDFT